MDPILHLNKNNMTAATRRLGTGRRLEPSGTAWATLIMGPATERETTAIPSFIAACADLDNVSLGPQLYGGRACPSTAGGCHENTTVIRISLSAGQRNP